MPATHIQLQAELDAALEKCAQLGADGVQIYAASGEMFPENMTAAARKEKRRLKKRQEQIAIQREAYIQAMQYLAENKE